MNNYKVTWDGRYFGVALESIGFTTIIIEDIPFHKARKIADIYNTELLKQRGEL